MENYVRRSEAEERERRVIENEREAIISDSPLPSPGDGGLRELLEFLKGYSEYVASIHWDGSRNTTEWLEGLREETEKAQRDIKAVLSRLAPAVPDMQAIMAGGGHPNEWPCVVCGAVFDTHAPGCVFEEPVVPDGLRELAEAAWDVAEKHTMGCECDKCKSLEKALFAAFGRPVESRKEGGG